MSRCRSCGAPIRWVLTESGKRMPLDFEPVEATAASGLFVIRDNHGEATAMAVPPGVYTGEPNYVSHFATCPQAALHRKNP